METNHQTNSAGPQTARQCDGAVGAGDVSALVQPPLAVRPASGLWAWVGPVRGVLRVRHGDRPEAARRLESLTADLFGSGVALGMSDIGDLTRGFVEGWCERAVGDGGGSGPRAPGESTVRFNRWAARRILEAAVDAGARIDPGVLVPLRNERRSAADAASIEAVVGMWNPRWPRTDLREGQVVLGVVRPWVLETGPPSVKVARSWLRIVADHTADVYRRDGTLDPDHVFHPASIDYRVMKVITGRYASTRRTVRSVLRRVGRAVAPAVSPRQTKSLGTVEAAVIYNAVEEESFRLAAELEWPSNRAARMWLSVATLGAGLNGVEAQMQGPAHVVAVGDGRLTVHVTGRNPRWVPIRADYTGLALEAVRLTSGDRFISSEAHGSASGLAKQLHVGGVGSLSLPRARATWIAAQLRSDVSLRALRRFSGPINHQTFDALVRQAAEEMDDETAVLKGLAA